MTRKTLITFFLFFTAWTCMLPVSTAGTQETAVAVEYKIKAAFLLNFTKFIKLPEESFTGEDQPYKVCVLGRNPIGSALTAIESRTVGNRKINLQIVDDVQQAGSCHLLFISSSEKNNLINIHETLVDHTIIMVSDIEGFAGSRGIVEFVARGDKLAFKINLSRAREQGLEINSALLNLATEIL